MSVSGREQKYEEGISLLRNALANQSDCVLHRMLGDFLVAVSDYQEAMDQYSIALRYFNLAVVDFVSNVQRQV